MGRYNEEGFYQSCDDRNYYRDRRVTATFTEPPAHGKFTWAICDVCEGHGKHVNPSIDASGLTSEDFADDPDFADDYMSGVYDVQCQQCLGSGKVVVMNGDAPKDDEDEGERPCVNPGGHKWVYSGTAYGGDDESYHGEGRCYCEHCGADGDA